MQGTVKHHSICIRHKERLAPPPRVEGDDLEHLDRKLAVTEELKNPIPKILNLVHCLPPQEHQSGHILNLGLNALHLGLGGTVRPHDNHLSGGTVIVATHDALGAYKAHIHGEAVGGPLILEEASKVPDLHGAVGYDPTAALTALRKGYFVWQAYSPLLHGGLSSELTSTQIFST